jgi:hypothetical protein
MDTHMHP